MLTNSQIIGLFIFTIIALGLLVLDSAGSGAFHRWLDRRNRK